VRNKTKPLVVIVGPTATGKTLLAIDAALQFDGEIICADSRTIYKGLDIGTAKPTKKEQLKVKHWGLDLISPIEKFSAFQFKEYAKDRIDDIRARGKLPILVGGSGLYVDAILYDYSFSDKYDESERRKLSALNIEQLHEILRTRGYAFPENLNNKQYVINTILRRGDSGNQSKQILDNSFVVGITTDRAVIKSRIEYRTGVMINEGVMKEALEASSTFGWDAPGLSGNIYRAIRRFVELELSEDQLKAESIKKDFDLAKRQVTWFKRRESTHWVPLEQSLPYIERILIGE